MNDEAALLIKDIYTSIFWDEDKMVSSKKIAHLVAYKIKEELSKYKDYWRNDVIDPVAYWEKLEEEIRYSLDNEK